MPSFKPLIMGIINVTPDSFSDGGKHFTASAAIDQGLRLLDHGADILDIGGESSRPGAHPVCLEEEKRRVLPVIEGLRRKTDICISIDTYKSEVMASAVNAGATMINDIYALTYQNSIETAAKLKVPICLMHMQGTPQTMQVNPGYQDVISDINCFLNARIHDCLQHNIPREHLILDPGIGFGKTVEDNFNLIKNVDQFRIHQRPILLGISRKSFLGKILNQKSNERTLSSLVAGLYAVFKGVSIVRTHDVEETKQALTVLQTIENI